MTRYTMPARSQGNTFMQRTVARLERDDVHRWVFVRNLTPEVESAVRRWLTLRLNSFYCDLPVVYTPPLSSMACDDEAVAVDIRGLNARNTAAASVKATGLNPHLSVCGWPFCLGDPDDSNAEGGAV